MVSLGSTVAHSSVWHFINCNKEMFKGLVSGTEIPGGRRWAELQVQQEIKCTENAEAAPGGSAKLWSPLSWCWGTENSEAKKGEEEKDAATGCSWGYVEHLNWEVGQWMGSPRTCELGTPYVPAGAAHLEVVSMCFPSPLTHSGPNSKIIHIEGLCWGKGIMKMSLGICRNHREGFGLPQTADIRKLSHLIYIS